MTNKEFLREILNIYGKGWKVAKYIDLKEENDGFLRLYKKVGNKIFSFQVNNDDIKKPYALTMQFATKNFDKERKLNFDFLTSL